MKNLLGSSVQEKKETPQDGGHPLQGAHNLLTEGLRSGRKYEKMLRIVKILLQHILASEEKNQIKQQLACLKMPRFGKRLFSTSDEEKGENRKHNNA